uniref:Small ribosomal subunit protein bS20c n=1 Tax=Corynoplastis japonica TaxID=700918 RepID=A0A1X9PTX5_9RHOD|nr:30S ribosomal protein S20 [Corynoplastis japonica]
MANKKSAIKRIKTSERNRLQNKSYKSVVKTLVKRCMLLIEKKELYDMINKEISLTYSKIDKAVKVGAIKLNNGSRKKSFLIKALRNSKT